MAKEKKKLELPAAADLPNAAPILKKLETRRAKVTATKAAATQDGAVKTSDPKYRTARKKLKRSQRALRRERLRVAQLPKPKEAPAAAAAPAAE